MDNLWDEIEVEAFDLADLVDAFVVDVVEAWGHDFDIVVVVDHDSVDAY